MTDLIQSKDRLTVYHVGIYNQDSPNGVNRVIYSYGQILQDAINFHVVSMDLEGAGHEQEQVGEVTVHHFPRWRMYGLLVPNELRAWIKTLPRDVLFHIHGVFNPANYMICRMLVRAGIPFVYTPHDGYSENSLRSHYRVKRAYIELCEKFILNNARSVHALTDGSVNDIRQFTQTRTVLLPNFITDPGAPTAEQLARRENIVFLGRLDIFQKGLDQMIDAYHAFRQTYQGKPPAFVLMGPDNENAIPKLQAQCEQLGLKVGEDVIFAGRVSEEVKHELLYTARVYFQLSRFEGFGMSVIEALSHALPVIISKEIPLAESIRTHGAGLVADSVEAGAELLRKAYSMSADEYQAWVQRARQAYIDLYSPGASKARAIEMYQEALQPAQAVSASRNL